MAVNRSAALLGVLVCVATACALLRSPPSGDGTEAGDARRSRRMRMLLADGRRAGPSYAVFPTQTIPLRFDHARHLAIANVTCVRCHTNAAQSAASSDRLVPPESVCTPCHAIDRQEPLRAATPAARCDSCHPGYDPGFPLRVGRVDIPSPNLTFSHRAHVSRGQTCESCHGDLRRVALGTRLDLPRMQSCLSCHRDGGTAAPACATCHLTQADGRLRTQFDEGWMNPPEWMTGLHHDADFWYSHRQVAREGSARCNNCHREAECVDCHDGRVRDRRTHPNDFATQHGMEARQASTGCATCHRASTFCQTCHARSGVALTSATLSRESGRFHPPADEWSGRTVGPRHHGMEARRGLAACVSCHVERDCTNCHGSTSLGGGGINPHPPGWISRCGALLRASSAGCVQCHADLGSIERRCGAF